MPVYSSKKCDSEDNVRCKRCSDSRHGKKSKKRMSVSSRMDSSDDGSEADDEPMTDSSSSSASSETDSSNNGSYVCLHKEGEAGEVKEIKEKGTQLQEGECPAPVGGDL
jgi:hypothetical protein